MEDVTQKDRRVTSRMPAWSRRDLIKKFGLGAGAAVTMLKTASAQQGQQRPPVPPTAGLGQASSQNVQHFPDITESQEVVTSVQPGYITKTGPGWVNNSGRASGNGPMD